MKKFITRSYGAARLLLKANGPTLMVAGGVAVMGAATVIACKQTLKVEEKLQPYAEALEHVDASDSDGSKAKLYAEVGKELTLTYAVPTTLFVGGAALVFGGHRILLKRNATLAIALSSTMRAFETYRENVRRHKGSEFDQAMLNGYTMRQVRDDETGEIVGESPTRDWDVENHPYNRVFGQGESKEWQDDLGVNIMFINNQQRFANQALNARGHLYLSEVYKSLGFPETDVSRVVGWKVKQLPDGTRDIPFVDFGVNKPHPDDWKYSQDNAVYLDFNVHGLIIGGKVQKMLEAADRA